MHDIDYVHKRQTGGAGQYARVKLRIISEDPGTGFTFVNSVTGGNIPSSYIPGVEKAAQDMVGSMDVTIELLDGAYHDIDSSILAFEIAGKLALTKAFEDMGTPLPNPFVLPPRVPRP